jgi:cysteine synthase
VKIICVEPADSPILTGGDPGRHKIRGIGANFVPEVLDRGIYDEIIDVEFDDAITVARALATSEGILGGISAGAAVWAALELAKHPENAAGSSSRSSLTSVNGISQPRFSNTSGIERAMVAHPMCPASWASLSDPRRRESNPRKHESCRG